ncbi:hypothetical protein Tco_1149776 [Tanacetum coccineum]
MSYTVELSKPYDCKVTIRLRPSTILFIQERLSKSNKRLKLFTDTIFRKYLDLDVEDNDNHLLNYVLHHQRPQLSKSIDSNIVFDISGHTLLFRRKIRLVWVKLHKVKLHKVKLQKGKAAKGKAAKGKAAKRKAAQGKAAQPSDKGDTHNVTILDLRLLIWDDEKWKKLSVEDSIRDSNPITQIRPDLKERDENWCRKTYDYVTCKERSKQVDDQNGFTHDDEPEAKQDGSGASDRASAGAKVEETKSTIEVVLEEELDLWKSRYVELESYYKNLEASVEIARKNLPGLSFPTPNAKVYPNYYKLDSYEVMKDTNRSSARAQAMSDSDENEGPFPITNVNAKDTSVCDDVGVPDAAAYYNSKAMSVHDDVGVHDAAIDDNAKAMSVCDDIDEADAAADDNVKKPKAKGIKETQSSQVPISDVYNTPIDNGDIFIKDAHDIINHADHPIHGFQIILCGGLEKKKDGLDEAKANQVVVSVADNEEVVKET